MKNIVDKIFVFGIAIISFGLLLMFIISSKNDFSEEENRYLATFDINNIEEYIEDHFYMRNNFISLKNKLEFYIGKTLINDIYIGSDNYLIPIFKTNNKRDLIVDAINKFNLINSNVDVMFVPDSILINEDKLKFHLNTLEEEEINYLYSKLNTNNINVINSLKNNNLENNLYYRTDHHWTSYGAYIAYKEYFKNKNKNYYNLSDYKITKVTDDFLGTSSSFVTGLATKEDINIFELKDTSLEVNYVYENKITNSLYNFDYLNKKDKYAMFLDNNHALITINNKNINDGSNILIIKNSYGNSFVPFIVNHYQNTHVIDLRYYPTSVTDYIKNNNISDILILYNLNNMYSDMSIIKLK
ncbi:MAG: hypothetical protein IJ572_02635 [Bacilli bacterium]|nr:hypothetical protein [Bacilli bacterium]